jgi:hypothetical protein
MCPSSDYRSLRCSLPVRQPQQCDALVCGTVHNKTTPGRSRPPPRRRQRFLLDPPNLWDAGLPAHRPWLTTGDSRRLSGHGLNMRRTLCLLPRQMGQSATEGSQSSQSTRWQQGWITMIAVCSRHTTQSSPALPGCADMAAALGEEAGCAKSATSQTRPANAALSAWVGPAVVCLAHVSAFARNVIDSRCSSSRQMATRSGYSRWSRRSVFDSDLFHAHSSSLHPRVSAARAHFTKLE